MPRQRKYQTNSERQAAYRRRCAQAGKIVQAADPIPSAPGPRRWKATLNKASVLLDCAMREMQGYFDQHSEAWQESQPGESLTEMLESVQDALSALEDVQHQTRQAKSAIT
jgi:hypothetical protein